MRISFEQAIAELHKQTKAALRNKTDAEHLECPMLHRPWMAGEEYELDEVVRYGDTLYRIAQPSVIAIASQPPDGEGMLAVYRPIVPEHNGTADDPIPFVSGMDVNSGKYYSYNDAIYLAKADMIPCVWPPDSGIWQWE